MKKELKKTGEARTIENFFIRGSRYTIVVDGMELLCAWDGDEGYKINSPASLENIERAWVLFNA